MKPCRTPCRRAAISRRRARGRGSCRALDYPGHVEVRRVSTIGQVSWRGAPLFLSEALAHADVAFEEVDDGLWTIRFASVVLGRFDDRHRRIHPIAPMTAGRSASCAGSAPDLKNKQ